MEQKHKHYKMIEEWARTGKQVQVFAGEWCDCTDNIPFWYEYSKYQFKPIPTILWHRRYVAQEGQVQRVRCLTGISDITPFNFVEWVDECWQEYEVYV